MKNRLFIIVGSLIVIVVVGAVAWYLTSFRFVSEAVDENSPPAVPSQERIVQISETKAESAQVPEEEQPAVEIEVFETATVMPDKMADASMPAETQPPEAQADRVQPTKAQPLKPQATETEVTQTPLSETQLTEVQVPKLQPTEPPTIETHPTEAEPIVILQGQFKDADSVHKGSGTATIYQRPDGTYLLSFEEFAVCCGPDLYVFLANNPSPTSHADLGDYLELSSLKASSGEQDYEISADTDLSQIKSVVIYCKPFQVIISTAMLG